MAATGTIQPGDLLLSVPRSAIFSHHELFQVSGPVELAPEHALLLAILVEARKGRESAWYEYLRLLPEQELILATWTMQDIELLQDTELIESAIAAKRKWKEVLSTFQQTVSTYAKDFTVDDIAWAWSIAASRSAYMEENAWKESEQSLRPPKANRSERGPGCTYDGSGVGVLIPLLDMFNHSCYPVSKAGYNPVSNTYDLIADAAYAAGEQVFIHYGPLSNRELVEHWGFTLRDNPHDSVRLSIFEITRAESTPLTDPDLISAAQILGLENPLSADASYAIGFARGKASFWDSVPWQLTTSLQLSALEARICDCEHVDLVETLANGVAVCGCVQKLCISQLEDALLDRHARLQTSVTKASTAAAPDHVKTAATNYLSCQDDIVQSILRTRTDSISESSGTG
uniref:SET domain-containing protein n=1 Tax=Rhodosorus marinus TaxID=101924 RepID=A0A7S3A4A0_9RHOD|mmetsp:Transcript_44372/g.172497  ORF Transcript_44372/g.172497 Transcript_44372/m.172497 type:complete len:402 (+) Transcript_44372:336-1541(+)